jgi:SAM-dependent methyltransferase
MAEPTIIFEDGAAYERGMGVWSRLAGAVFLDWLAPAAGQRWLDVGCGNGVFTELLIERCTPSEAQGVDPSEGQLAFARTRPGTGSATFLQGDAMALPFPDDRFDAAAMALVIFFVPEPEKGLAEMVRVVRPGGLVTAYAWDIPGDGFPFRAIQAELRALGKTPVQPPSAQVSRMETLRDLWISSGLERVETREITVQRQFADFEDFWVSSTNVGAARPMLTGLQPGEIEQMRDRLRAHLPPGPDGRVVYTARANAIRGFVPA